MKSLQHFVLALTALACSFLAPRAQADATYIVRQTFTVKDLPADAKQVRGWFWMPEDRAEQKVAEFRVVEAPESFQITRDPRYGRKWLYADVKASADQPLRIVTEFKVVRRSVLGMGEVEKARPLTEEDRRAMAVELRRDEKHMEITPTFQKIADEIAGTETNPVVEARKFFDYVIAKSEHYSKFGPTQIGRAHV